LTNLRAHNKKEKRENKKQAKFKRGKDETSKTISTSRFRAG